MRISYVTRVIQGSKKQSQPPSTETLHHLKLSFPKFKEETSVTEWLQDCEQYFTVFGIVGPRRVAIAGMHLEGTARRWFQVFMAGGALVEWEDFSASFLVRFGILEQELLYDKFKQLKQESSVEVYHDQFERYMEKLKGKLPHLIEEYFVESFVSGLKGEVKNTVRLLAPTSVEQAYKKARSYLNTTRIQEGSIQEEKHLQLRGGGAMGRSSNVQLPLNKGTEIAMQKMTHTQLEEDCNKVYVPIVLS